MTNSQERFWDILENYSARVKAEAATRIEKWGFDIENEHQFVVVGGLLARQATLASEISAAPSIWNEHMAPIFLRVMVDLHINLAWILKDPETRAKSYIEYGLGQAKLMVEHRKVDMVSKGLDPQNDQAIQATEAWLNSQRLEFLVEVNVGNWADSTIRNLAIEADQKSLYDLSYVPFSNAVHNTWWHVGRFNSRRSPNPLHRFHFIPTMDHCEPHPHYLKVAAKYADKSFQLFDDKIGIAHEAESAFLWLDAAIADLEDANNSENSEEKASGQT